MTPLIKATLAGFVVFVGASGLFYGVLMADQYAVWEADVARAEPMMGYGMAGFLIMILVMSAMYPKGYQGGDPLKEGARFGMMVGLIISGLVLAFYGGFEFQLAGIVSDIVFNVALLSLVGAVIGKVYGPDAA